MKKLLLLLIVCISSDWLMAQSSGEIRFITRGESIEEALNKWVVQFNTNLVYDPELELAQESFVDITTNQPGLVLTEIIADINLDFIILSTGTYVLIERSNVVEEYGEFFGYVYDDETGEPLADATIYFADASNSTTTNNQGFFSVSPLLSGTYPVIVSSVGYNPLSKDVNVEESSGLSIIRLTPKMFTSDPVIVQADAISLGMNKWANENISVENSISELSTSPSLGSVVNTPGFSKDFGSNSLSIYGSNPSTMTILLDGVRMYNTVRIGDALGMFSPLAIDKIGTSKAAGSITNKGSLSGILNFQQDIIDRSDETSLVMKINPDEVNARSEFQIGKTTFAVSGRSNSNFSDTPWGYENVYRQWNQFDPLLQNFIMGGNGDIAHYKAGVQETELGYNDLHFIGQYSSNFTSTKFSGYFGSRIQEASLLSEKSSLGSSQPFLVYNEEDLTTQNGMFNVEHFRVVNAQTDLFLKASYSASSYNYEYSMIQNDELISHSRTSDENYSILQADLREITPSFDKQNVNEISLSGQLTRYVSARNTLIIGFNSNRIDHSFVLNDSFYLPLSNNEENYRGDLFVEQKFNLSEQFRFQYGLKGSITSRQEVFYVQPQFSVTFDSKKTRLGYHTLQFSSGLYRQFIQQFDIANVGPSAIQPFNRIDIPIDGSISAPLSFQTKFEWNIQYSEDTKISLGSYYRNEPKSYMLDYSRLLAGSNISFTDQSEFLERTSTIAYGASITLEKEFKDPALQLTLSQQTNISTIRFDERFNNERIQTGWSEPYSTNGTLKWIVSNPLSIQLQTKWIPKRYWAFTRAYYDFLTTHNETSFGEFSLNSPDDDQLSAFFSLDLGINSRIVISNTSLLINLSLQNVTNRENEVSYILIPQRNAQQEISYTRTARKLAGFIPFLSLQLDF